MAVDFARVGSWRVSVVFLAVLAFSPVSISLAQTPVQDERTAQPVATDEVAAPVLEGNEPAPAPAPPSTPSLERRFIKNVLSDQAVIWTSPFHLKGNDAWVLVPIGVGTAALIASDRHTTGLIGKSGSQLSISANFSRVGAAYTTFGAAAAFYLIGRHTGNTRARETGLLAAEALVDGEIVSGLLKVITQRPRPNESDGHGRFFTGGDSFPSGHSVQAWTLATVISKEYGSDHPLVSVAMYGLAAMTGLSRYSGRKHFLSDVLIGSAIGYGIGRYVYNKRHDSSLDAAGSAHKHFKSALLPTIAPQYSPGQRLYGARLSWGD